ncbi:3-deoxy-7-phosphoheptulonate synthase [Alkaliphilus oremlandii]|uniref:Phospho-2-dehydro-3-deoxyheptonate aldolase n=1 Tax=Alkaliphilus oremlandii (strain OhILAs) TaxID=350688 RepID=A8MH70_ALKOO|nr:3-deoxy-7-phosphoheptulonate synthase [Alkaliphilus oremlandii]ABW18957.1 phospho-2-dehydro-3-deoxyheptonate aldolase [Alkaliphilus oremlandii OhILAs]
MNLNLIGKKNHEENKIIQIGNLKIGSGKAIVIAGPCSIENEQQIDAAANIVKKLGGHILRGGAFKPRTSPYSFQGLGEEGLRLLKEAGEKYGLPVVSEVMDTRDVEMVSKYVDILQIGSRNMQNFSLLKEVGRTQKPILLKRGMTATIEDWLMAAEYIAYEGNEDIILCERGVRTFETYTRNTLDLAAVPIIKNLSKLPIIVDPSHGTGRKELIRPMTKASLAAGADGVMIEIHPNPCEALSDGEQSLNFEEFHILMKEINH